MIKTDHLLARLAFGVAGVFIGLAVLPVLIVTIPFLLGWVLCQEWDSPIRPDDRDIIVDDADIVCNGTRGGRKWLR